MTTPEPALRAVCFDLDGTLVDSTEAIVASFMHTFDVLGEPRPARQAIVGSIGHLLEDQFGLLTHHDPHDCTVIYREHYGRTCNANTTLIPGALETLERLSGAGLPLGFATSKRRSYAEQILEHLGILRYFAARIGPDDVTHAKPHPEALLTAAAHLGVEPAHMAYVGDTHFDMRAARRAGCPCLGVTLGYGTREELASHAPAAIFDDLGAVADWILARHDPVPA